MKWEPNGPYAIKSGHYTITKNSTSQGWIYLAFCKSELICRAKTGDEAKGICHDHLLHSNGKGPRNAKGSLP